VSDREREPDVGAEQAEIDAVELAAEAAERESAELGVREAELEWDAECGREAAKYLPVGPVGRPRPGKPRSLYERAARQAAIRDWSTGLVAVDVNGNYRLIGEVMWWNEVARGTWANAGHLARVAAEARLRAKVDRGGPNGGQDGAEDV